MPMTNLRKSKLKRIPKNSCGHRIESDAHCSPSEGNPRDTITITITITKNDSYRTPNPRRNLY